MTRLPTAPRPQVLWLCSWYPNLGQPQNGDFTQRYARAVGAVAEVTVVTVAELASCEPYTSEDIVDGVREIRAYVSPASTPVQKVYRITRAYLRELRRLRLEGYRPSILHLQVIPYAGLAAVFWSWRYSLPLVITENYTGYLAEEIGNRPYLARALARLVARKATQITAVSQMQLEDLGELGFRGGVVIPNVVRGDLFHPAKDLRDGGDKFRFLHVSFLGEVHKRPRLMLRAAALLKARQPTGWELIIVGGTDQGVTELREYSLALGLGEHVHFWGMVPLERVAETMQTASAMVHPSLYETFSCVVAEALATGLPVITSRRVGAVRDMDHPAVIKLADAEPTSLADAMERLFSQTNSHRPTELRALVLPRCSPEAVGEAFVNVYSRCLAP